MIGYVLLVGYLAIFLGLFEYTVSKVPRDSFCELIVNPWQTFGLFMFCLGWIVTIPVTIAVLLFAFNNIKEITKDV